MTSPSEYHPDVEGADPGGNRDTVVAQKLGAALFAQLGMESPVPVGSFFDVFPLSVLTTSTLAQLGGVRPTGKLPEFAGHWLPQNRQISASV